MPSAAVHHHSLILTAYPDLYVPPALGALLGNASLRDRVVVVSIGSESC